MLAPVVTVREATAHDIAELVELYRDLAEEMLGLEEMWHRIEALPEPVEASLSMIIGDPEQELLVGMVDDVLFGFLHGLAIETLPNIDGEVGSVRIVYTDPAAREVGVAEALLYEFMDRAKGRGVKWFDAHVLPGHRLAKNFFEASGFSARHIVMSHTVSED